MEARASRAATIAGRLYKTALVVAVAYLPVGFLVGWQHVSEYGGTEYTLVGYVAPGLGALVLLPLLRRWWRWLIRP